ncbi:NAD(P)H-dependent oxidoreductase subunit E [Isachenkonia alkalipeptolytica]|uniref:Uncharacterized protein n=1 Tax=Isachenkonia alkalipeptolytica TaxID=2565777 RepID=A0AA43XLU6_9CLOT|nr:NAD(P)H-dependent oxidoreductase subunit E [Isachenkonia alkalipeptolytica]NBG88831.1 hypothetical protein [Isachenkonia alkalipeptolytica]
MMKVEICEHCAGEEMEEVIQGFKDFEEALKEKSMTLNVEKTGCLGSCQGPVVRVNGKVYTEVHPNEVEGIVSEVLKQG